jgi:predicted extracellular nuclease
MRSPEDPMLSRILLIACLPLVDLVSATPAHSAQTVTISQIQGRGHASSLERAIVKTRGIVTKKVQTGLYLQDATGDGDDATSDGIFAHFNKPVPDISPGSLVEVEGEVDETSAFNNALTVTRLQVAKVTVISTGQTMAPTVVGQSGRQPPTEIIDDDGLSAFEPASDGIDFWESLEGMLIRVNDAVVVGGTSRGTPDEAWIVAEGGRNATGMNKRGGITIAPGDFNPERVRIEIEGNTPPRLAIGDRISVVEGTLRYEDGSYEILVSRLETITPAAPVVQPAPEPTATHLTIASFNAKNLDPRHEELDKVTRDKERDDDVAAGQFAAIAGQVVQVLGAPDIIGFQEFQDDDGAEFSDTVSAQQTAATLIQAIIAAGGPTYSFLERAPDDDAQGGQPGGNIRVVFLFNPAR